MQAKPMEILAPVGGREQLLAAIRCGANAVYLGTKGFNARKNAENFDDQSLAQAVAYCHARGVFAYVTLNTLVTDDELPALVDTLREIAQSGADAVIVQDLAVARLAREHCPQTELHASTQMTIHNAAGAKQLEAMGFARVVLARELSLAEIAAIHAQTSLELEVFVHGALCMSVSGACYLSAMLGGRSGNRGLCAQPCRLDFTSGGRHYALSLKDLSAIGHLQALMDAGVYALKIEGRMKRPEYVAAAVTACRKALAGEPYDLQTLQAVFSRGGFTDGYLMGRRNLSMFGTRSQEDAQASRQAHKQLTGLYQHERPAIPVDMTLTVQAGAQTTLSITDGSHSVTIAGDAPQPAQTTPTDHPRAMKHLAKTGETPFWLRTLTLDADGASMLPAAALNALRRQALAALLAQREVPAPKPFIESPPPVLPAHEAPATPALRLRFAHAGQLFAGIDAEQVSLPLHAISPEHIAAFGGRLAAELPSLVFPGDENTLQATLRALRGEGLSHAVCHNLGVLAIAKAEGYTLHGGHGLNILNSLSLDAYAALGLVDATLSFELHAQKIRRLGGALSRGILAYGYLPLMLLRCCPAQQAQGCAGCDGNSALRDRKGLSLPLSCHQHAYTTLHNALPLNLLGDPIAGIDFHTLYFTQETAEACRRIRDAFASSAAPDAPYTRGLYHRTLQ